MKNTDCIEQALEALGARYSMTIDPDKNPIPKEATLDQVIHELYMRLKMGMPLHPPIPSRNGESFTGMVLNVSDPIDPQTGLAGAKMRVIVQIHTNLTDRAVQIDQSFIAYGIMSIALNQFIADAEAEQEKKSKEAVDKAVGQAKDNIERFPTPPAPATQPPAV